MYDKSRGKKASGEMPRAEMSGAPAATEMPTGEMTGGYADASGGLQSAPSGGTNSPSLYDEMFGLHEIRTGSTASSGTMPEAPASSSAANAPAAEGPMPGAALGAESATGQHTIEITGRWRVTLTPAP